MKKIKVVKGPKVIDVVVLSGQRVTPLLRERWGRWLKERPGKFHMDDPEVPVLNLKFADVGVARSFDRRTMAAMMRRLRSETRKWRDVYAGVGEGRTAEPVWDSAAEAKAELHDLPGK